jgi:DNA-binding response OmpR family regulator
VITVAGTTEGKQTILVVDDEQDVLDYLTTFFEDNGFATLSAKDGEQGFAVAKEQAPALITLDITMPQESGVRMFRDLQADADTATIPVVMVTGVSGEFEQFIRSRRQVKPPDAYFEKPVDREALLAKVRELLE